MNILVTCTANQCRSPMAEVLLRAALDMRRISADVSSAGLMQGGAPAVENAVIAVKSLGLDLESHRSRQLDSDIVGAADLILTMERMHVREITMIERGAFTKTFTIVDFVARAGRKWPAGAPLNERLEAFAVGRSPADLMGNGNDEVADPIGQSLQVFEKTRDDLVRLTKQVASLLAG